jgi:cobalamin biosynthesis protein CobD/CbiB
MSPERIASFLADLAASSGELEATWRAVCRVSYEDRVAVRLREMEAASAALSVQLGHPAGYVYTGGAVRWN